jgi:rhodanese-related sulfurtransferase
MLFQRLRRCRWHRNSRFFIIRQRVPMLLPLETDCNTVKSLRDAGADFLLLDCREQDEYDLVRIDGALFVPMSQIQTRLEELRPHQERQIVVHCHLGGRSFNVASWLRQQGFPHAQSLVGGIDQWAAEIDPSLPRY